MKTSFNERFKVVSGIGPDGFIRVWYYVDKTNGNIVYSDDIFDYVRDLMVFEHVEVTNE